MKNYVSNGQYYSLTGQKQSDPMAYRIVNLIIFSLYLHRCCETDYCSRGPRGPLANRYGAYIESENSFLKLIVVYTKMIYL